MPAFFDPHFWDLANAEFWVGAGLVIFLGIVVLVGAPKAIAGKLDAAAATIQADLDEAARLRAEAEAMLKDLKAQRLQAEEQAQGMLEAATAEARRLEAEAEERLAESIARRETLAERRIALAESQAAAAVKAAAAELAVQAAERILAERLAAQTTDPLVDTATAQLASRLN